jgi:hypothetical protein
MAAIVSATTTDIVKKHRVDEGIRHEGIASHPGLIQRVPFVTAKSADQKRDRPGCSVPNDQ